MFSGNDLPVGPNGTFPPSRMRTGGNVLTPVRDAEGEYLMSPVAQLPTQEKEFASVSNAAKRHLLFGESKRLKPASLMKMGGGFQVKAARTALIKSGPMPGHGEAVDVRGARYKMRMLEMGRGPQASIEQPHQAFSMTEEGLKPRYTR